MMESDQEFKFAQDPLFLICVFGNILNIFLSETNGEVQTFK